jgi:hypothetical protein
VERTLAFCWISGKPWATCVPKSAAH